MPKRSGRAAWFAGGVVAGAALGWLTAPRRGDWVRNQIRQKFGHWGRMGRIRLVKRGRDFENRLWGSVAEARQAWTGHEHYVDANTLVDQVHTELGRQFSGTLSHVNLNAYGHTIYLHGYVESEAERRRLIEAIGAVDGVDAVAAGELRIAPPPEHETEPAPGCGVEADAPRSGRPHTDVRESSAPMPPQSNAGGAGPHRRSQPGSDGDNLETP